MNYIPTADFIAYAAARGVVFTDSKADIALVKAMDYMNLLPWQGEKTDPAQPLDWPRTGIAGVDPQTTPKQIVDAQCRLAMVADKMDLMPVIKGGPQLIEKTMQGVGTFKYAESNGLDTLPAFPWLTTLLDGLVEDAENYGLNFRVRRG